MNKKAMYMTSLTLIFALSILSGAITIGTVQRSIDIKVTNLNETTGIILPNLMTTGDGIVNKYALVIGISDYNVISDLSYCDEDATDWFNYLDSLGYQITLLGDSHPETFPQWDGYATEYNVRVALADIFSLADEDDIVVLTSSGHGGRSRSKTLKAFVYFLCMWDTNAGEEGFDGLITNYELQEMMEPSVSSTFVFLDHCYSGGFGDIFLNPNAEKFYMATTCTDNGFGWDDPVHQNGKWTYFFLEYALIGELGGKASMEEAFAVAYPAYLEEIHRPGDVPMEFDGSPDTLFYL
ncbi:MAG: caspase family protein [Candidatus Heimdallarchaeota archaeon]